MTRKKLEVGFNKIVLRKTIKEKAVHQVIRNVPLLPTYSQDITRLSLAYSET